MNQEQINALNRLSTKARSQTHVIPVPRKKYYFIGVRRGYPHIFWRETHEEAEKLVLQQTKVGYECSDIKYGQPTIKAARDGKNWVK